MHYMKKLVLLCLSKEFFHFFTNIVHILETMNRVRKRNCKNSLQKFVRLFHCLLHCNVTTIRSSVNKYCKYWGEDYESETRRQSVRTQAILLYANPNHDLSTLNDVTSTISQCHSLSQVWTLWDYLFLSYAPTVRVKYADTHPVTLTFDLSTPNPRHY